MSNLRKWLITASVIFNIAVYSITFHSMRQNHLLKKEIRELMMQSDSLDYEYRELVKAINELEIEMDKADSLLQKSDSDSVSTQ